MQYPDALLHSPQGNEKPPTGPEADRGKERVKLWDQIRATPERMAASATALATAGPTRGSKACGMM